MFDIVYEVFFKFFVYKKWKDEIAFVFCENIVPENIIAVVMFL